MKDIDINQAKKCLPELIEHSISGDGVIITRGGEPVAKLIAIFKPKKQRTPGTAKNLITISDDFDEPLEDLKDYM